jgi:coenzyme F420-reducing hydrogenase delta subunit/NAD-dependent dihydropyrimidine dehydrogenase PreA subunit
MVLAGLLVVSLALPATSQGPADLAKVPAEIGIDWFFLPLYPLIDIIPAGLIWGGVTLFTLVLCAIPWILPVRTARPAQVFLDHCNGCARCVEDCPYAAIELTPRTDGAPFPHQVVVDPGRCVSCGICMGSCPSSSPFRRRDKLVTGIDLPDFPLTELRQKVVSAAATLEGPARILTLACEHGAASPDRDTVVLPCVAMAPPSLIDFILSRGHADGVCIAGCAERGCQHRLGVEWTKQRFAGERDPYLRARVPRERIETIWSGPTETARLAHETEAFRDRLAALPQDAPRFRRAAPAPEPVLEGTKP